MPRDKETWMKFRRIRNRSLDFNPHITTTAPVNDTDSKGLGNAHIYVSATVPQLCIKIDGTYWRIAMTSAF